jgi:DNA-binding MarR family transcriptional regulator
MDNKTEYITRIETAFLAMRNFTFRNAAHHHSDFPVATILLLRTLAEHYAKHDNPLSTTELAKRMHVSPPAITQLLNILEKKHLTERVKPDHDRRITNVVLTRKGRSLLKHIGRGRRGSMMIGELLDYLGPDDSAELARLVERISEFMKQKRDRG